MPPPSPTRTKVIAVRSISPTDDFWVGEQRIPPPAPRGIRFLVDGRRVDLYRTPGSGAWRLMVDGLHLPVAFRKATGMARWYEDRPGPFAQVETPPLGNDGLLKLTELDARWSMESVCLHGHWSERVGDAHNTAVYEYFHLTFVFRDDFSSVEIELCEDIDASN